MYTHTHTHIHTPKKKISIYYKTLPQKFMFTIRVRLWTVYLVESKKFLVNGRNEEWEK